MLIHVSREVRSIRNVGLALSGGGSRAIAFHLGCLRALYDRGVLDRLRVIYPPYQEDPVHRRNVCL